MRSLHAWSASYEAAERPTEFCHIVDTVRGDAAADDRRVPNSYERAPELAGDLLSQIAFTEDGTASAFNEEFSRTAEPEERERMTAFVAAQERNAWLDHDDKRGKLRFR